MKEALSVGVLGEPENGWCRNAAAALHTDLQTRELRGQAGVCENDKLILKVCSAVKKELKGYNISS